MVQNKAHGLIDAAHQYGDVAAVELVGAHHFAAVALRPEYDVLKDGHAVRVLENLEAKDLVANGIPILTWL